MSEELEIILRAIDDASPTFESLGQSAEEVGSTLQQAFAEATSEVERLEEALTEAYANGDDIEADYLADELAFAREEAEKLEEAMNSVNGGAFDEASAGADEFEKELTEADDALDDMNNDLGLVNSAMLMQLGQEVGQLGAQAEGMAQDMNTAAISVGQLATQTGIAEPKMVALINNISNATFPNDEAMMYVKSLDQMGVSSENLGASATNIDKINDAFGLGAETTNSLAQELGVLGVDMNNVGSSFNALAYANANTVGGMQNYYSFLRKYDAQFNELGYSVDQASVIIAAATQKYGGGRAALSGLSTALKEAGGDAGKLEQALDLQAGSITNATSLTSQYEGQLQALADEEAEHKTILDQLGAAWEDLSLSIGALMSPLLGVIGVIGQIGSFGLQIQGLRNLITLVRELTAVEVISNAVKGIKIALTEAVIAATIAYSAIVAVLSGEIGVVTAATMIWNAVLAMNPIMLVVIALVALVAAIYAVGQAFGWWDNVQGMLSAVWTGLNRLWSAFINHPDVQAILSAIGYAFQVVSGAVMSVIGSILEFFGVTTGGNFDIVRAIIDGIGAAWDSMKLRIQLVVFVFQTLYNGIMFVVNGIQWLAGIFSSAWTNITSTTNLNAFQILSIIFSTIGRIPALFSQFLLAALSKVVSIGAQWVSNAKAKAKAMLTGVVSTLKSLPSRVYAVLKGVVSKIVSAISAWITAAKNKAQGIVNGVGNVLGKTASAVSSALSGVKDAIVKPFQDAYNTAKDLWDKISSLGGAFGGEPAAYGGEPLVTNSNVSDVVSASTPIVDNSPIVIEDNINLSVDLRNVPVGVDTDSLIECFSNQSVLNALVDNRKFQDLDAKVKLRLNGKVRRSRGL